MKKLKVIIMNVIASSHLLPSFIRVKIYKLCGIEMGKCAYMAPNILMNGVNIKVGDGSTINYGCVFENAARIEIGKNCGLGMEVLLCSANHKIGEEHQRWGDLCGSPIIIEDGCWIGSRTTILPGVTVGKGCVIGAGSLVTKDCEPNGLYAGSPARRIKDLDTQLPKDKAV